MTRPNEDVLKGTMGTGCCFAFVATAVSLHWAYLGFWSFLSLRAASFIVVGMFAAPLTAGVGAYLILVLVFRLSRGRESIEVAAAFLTFFLAVAGSIYEAIVGFHWFYRN